MFVDADGCEVTGDEIYVVGGKGKNRYLKRWTAYWRRDPCQCRTFPLDSKWFGQPIDGELAFER